MDFEVVNVEQDCEKGWCSCCAVCPTGGQGGCKGDFMFVCEKELYLNAVVVVVTREFFTTLTTTFVSQVSNIVEDDDSNRHGCF